MNVGLIETHARELTAFIEKMAKRDGDNALGYFGKGNCSRKVMM